MNRELPLYNRALCLTLSRTGMALSYIHALYYNTAFKRKNLKDLPLFAFIVATYDDNRVVLLDVQLNLLDPCFHFSLI